MSKKTITTSSGYMSLLGDIEKNMKVMNEEPSPKEETVEDTEDKEPIEVEESEVQDKRRKKGRPRTNTRKTTKTSQEGLPEGYTRATIIVEEDSLTKVKVIATIEGLRLKDIVSTILNEYVERYERKNGEIRIKK